MPQKIENHGVHLVRQMGLLGLIATGVCSMVGAAINVIPLMVQRNVPGIGSHVLLAYLLAVIPTALAALAYAQLASAMPRAGGSYVYASRALSPYLGFIASFSQWFGLTTAIGVVSYLLIPFLRDVAIALEMTHLASSLSSGGVRVGLALLFVWAFAAVNVRGVQLYQKTLIPLMFLMVIGGAIVIPWGFVFDHSDFIAALSRREGLALSLPGPQPIDWSALLAASAILFSTFIGFDSIAQAGGEARNPGRALPMAIGCSVAAVAAYYLLFTASIYHAVPWNFVAERARSTDLTAPGLLGYLLPKGWTVAMIGGAAVALINDLPAMILAVSRLLFAWSEDGIFPSWVGRVHARWHTPHRAIGVSAGMASLAILGSHFAGDFFLGVDILITSMLINFILICISVLALPGRNPVLAARLRFGKSLAARVALGGGGAAVLTVLLATHVAKDLTAPAAWYFRSTWLWLLVVGAGSALFRLEMSQLRRRGVDVHKIFSTLPPE